MEMDTLTLPPISARRSTSEKQEAAAAAAAASRSRCCKLPLIHGSTRERLAHEASSHQESERIRNGSWNLMMQTLTTGAKLVG